MTKFAAEKWKSKTNRKMFIRFYTSKSKLIPVDGQHRVLGLIHALEANVATSKKLRRTPSL